ncbi:hypothetical protein [Leucobacter japonicus]|uniref:hypothetical protein n=1 Tax=Leucobacter japonicus TaxID=1461259 RepID=UPI0006A7AED2|nr:hypothetical protein [Leucobacter japonicus]
MSGEGIRHRSMRTRIAAGVVALALGALVLAPKPQATEATWSDPEVASGTFTALTVPAPVSTANCVLVPGALGLDPKITISWRTPAGVTGYDLTNVEYGYVSGGVLIPVVGALLGNVATSGTTSAYTTVVSSGLLSGLLGGSIIFGIRFKGPGGWTSSWLTANASMGLAGINPTCTMGTAPSP